MPTDLDAAVQQQLVARNGEILKYILAQPTLTTWPAARFDGLLLFGEYDDFSSGEGELELEHDPRYQHGYPHYGFERTA